MRKTALAFMALAAMVSCATKQTEPQALVLYYSQTNSTKAVAEEIALQTGADIVAFDVEQPYDGTYQETIMRGMQERSSGEFPKLAELGCDLSKYDVIYLGYPIWYGTYAIPVSSLLAEVDLNGKTIIPFCTFGSGGLQSSSADLKAALPGADIREGYGVRAARIDKAKAEVEQFLIRSGLIEGEAIALPEFSAQQPITEAEAAIFDAACSSYPMPLGTPVTVGSRSIPNGTEYLFTAESMGADGTPSKACIYVTAEEGSAPEFTQAVR